MSDGPCPLAHTPEAYTVRVRFHRDSTACVELEYPDHRTHEEAREVLAMLGELGEGADMIAVTPAGRLVRQRRPGP